jgi:hypothetical protein
VSYIKSRGEQAANDALKDKQDFSKALVKFKSGTTLTVRFCGAEDYVRYDAVSIFGKITTTPVLDGNLYDKATKVLYDDANAETDEKKSEEIRQLASQLRPKQRYLIAFIDLSTGQPAVVDVTKNQAKIIIEAIKKYGKKLSTLPFELSKNGQGQSTTLSVSPVVDIDDMTKDERKHWKNSEEAVIADEIFDLLYVKSEAEQIEDLQKIGFDLSRIGLAPQTSSDSDEYDF